MRCSIALLFLAPIACMAGVIENCYATLGCGYSLTENAVGNVVTVDFSAQASFLAGGLPGGTFTLNDTLVADVSPGSTIWAEVGSGLLSQAVAVEGTVTGNIGPFSCGISNFDPDPITNPGAGIICGDLYPFPISFTPSNGQIPINMQLSLGFEPFGGGSLGQVDLQVSFFSIYPAPGQYEPLAVQFVPAPEPGSIALCGIGLMGLVFTRRRRTCGGNLGLSAQSIRSGR